MAELARQHIADARPDAPRCDLRWSGAALAAPSGEFIGHTTISIG
jgi:hypothetical protein